MRKSILPKRKKNTQARIIPVKFQLRFPGESPKPRGESDENFLGAISSKNSSSGGQARKASTPREQRVNFCAVRMLLLLLLKNRRKTNAESRKFLSRRGARFSAAAAGGKKVRGFLCFFSGGESDKLPEKKEVCQIRSKCVIFSFCFAKENLGESERIKLKKGEKFCERGERIFRVFRVRLICWMLAEGTKKE